MSDKRWLVAGALCLALGWLAVLHSVASNPSINADASYPLVMSHDIAVRGWRGVFWMTPPANGLFPDVALVAAALGLGFDGLANFSAWYACFALMLFGATWFFLSARGRLSLAPSVAALAVALLILCGDRDDGLTTLYISPDHHQVAMVVTLLALGLYRRRAPLPLAALIAVGVFSDPIVAAQSAVPLIVLASIDRAPRATAAPVVGVVIGYGSLFLLPLVAPLERGGDNHHWGRVASSTLALVAGLPHAIGYASPLRGWLGLGCLVALGSLVRKSRLALELAAATMFAVVSPGLVGTWTGPSLYRQQLPLFFFPALGCLWLLAEQAAARWRWTLFALAPIGMLAALLVNLGGLPRLFGREALFRGQGEVVRTLRKRGVTAVAATYWAAKPLWLQSRGQLSVCQLNPDGGRLSWIVDTRWCDEFVVRAAGEPVVAVVSETPWGAALARRYGETRSRETVHGYEIRYYKPAEVLPRLAVASGRL
jgi:hypothetical protein